MRSNTLITKSLCLLLFLFSITTITISAQTISEGFVGYYPMTEGIVDESGNGNDGVKTKVNLHDDISGEGLGSYRYNGKKDLISLPIDINSSHMQAVTVSAWVYFERLGSDQGIAARNLCVLENKNGAGAGLWLGLKEKGEEKGYWAVTGESSSKAYLSTCRMKLREWTFVAVTIDYSKSSCVLYVDNQRFNTGIKVADGNEMLYLGSMWEENKRNEYFIDEVSVYDRVLSSKEIKALKNSVTVHDAKKERDEISKYDYFIVKVDSTRVKAAPNVDTPHLGFVYEGDSIPNGTVHKNEGRGYYKWLKTTYKGETGYLIMANLERTNPYAEKKLNKAIFDRFGFHDKSNWIKLLVVLLVVYILSFKFSWIDSLLSLISHRGEGGGRAGFPIFAGLMGAVMGMMVLVFERQANYLYHHFTLLPIGQGLGAWIIIACIAVMAVMAVKTLLMSLIQFGIIHGLLRSVFIFAFGAVTFFGTLLVSIVLIYIAIALVFSLVMGNAAILHKYKVRYSDGSTGVEYM